MQASQAELDLGPRQQLAVPARGTLGRYLVVYTGMPEEVTPPPASSQGSGFSLASPGHPLAVRAVFSVSKAAQSGGTPPPKVFLHINRTRETELRLPPKHTLSRAPWT